MFYFGRGFIPLAALIIGIGLIFNCTRAILRREDSWDSESTNQMMLANTVGVIIGVCLVAGVFWLYSGGLTRMLWD